MKNLSRWQLSILSSLFLETWPFCHLNLWGWRFLIHWYHTYHWYHALHADRFHGYHETNRFHGRLLLFCLRCACYKFLAIHTYIHTKAGSCSMCQWCRPCTGSDEFGRSYAVSLAVLSVARNHVNESFSMINYHKIFFGACNVIRKLEQWVICYKFNFGCLWSGRWTIQLAPDEYRRLWLSDTFTCVVPWCHGSKLVLVGWGTFASFIALGICWRHVGLIELIEAAVRGEDTLCKLTYRTYQLILVMLGDFLSECHRQQMEARSSHRPTAYVPECTGNGDFSPKQCHLTVRQCWCVYTNGREVQGTRRISSQRLSCQKEYDPSK